MLSALDDIGIDTIIEMIYEIYNSGEIPEDFSRYKYTPAPNNPGAN